MEQLARFARLPRRDQSLLVAAASLIVAFRIALWVLPFRAVRAWVQRMGTERASPSRDAATIGSAVEAAARRIPFSNCLSNALAGQVLMSRSGVISHVRIGVARDADGRVTAHAWVESGGRGVIGAHGSQRFEEASGSGRVV
jgi:hypothetical protein